MAGATGYSGAAERLAHEYEAVSFEQVHGAVVAWLPGTPSRVIDIGAGTGRDAAALAARGHTVTAVEPTAEFRVIGRALHGGAVHWLDDSLPELRLVRGVFDLVLLSAVWMHLDDVERRTAMTRIAGLLAPGGRLVLTLRHGPVPAGRRMFDVSVVETVDLAGALGLKAVHHSETADVLGRPDVRWSSLVLVGAAE
ncbi:class I SAM-dependent methyltransferase [Actinokineospora inagensis]|uniref:class I SAM-dependent methyltransferase n=1 Tax=Actinokineospora inagensis TaxID=103730 RepID=UPI000415992D|nr:class I SAM-dependent methyltransferase [Actinokineospora inagensis]